MILELTKSPILWCLIWGVYFIRLVIYSFNLNLIFFLLLFLDLWVFFIIASLSYGTFTIFPYNPLFHICIFINKLPVAMHFFLLPSYYSLYYWKFIIIIYLHWIINFMLDYLLSISFGVLFISSHCGLRDPLSCIASSSCYFHLFCSISITISVIFSSSISAFFHWLLVPLNTST